MAFSSSQHFKSDVQNRLTLKLTTEIQSISHAQKLFNNEVLWLGYIQPRGTWTITQLDAERPEI